MRIHADIISQADCRQIAELRGVSIHTVRSWGQRNSIPAEHWSALVDAGIAKLPDLIAGVRPRSQRAA